MRKLWLTALVVLALPIFSFATVLTFGPLCSGTCVGPAVPDGYGGLTWNGGFYAVGNGYYDSTYGNTYGAPSGGAAYNAFGNSPLTVNSASPFYFTGADFTSWAQFDAYASFSSVTVTIDAYDALSNHIGSVTATLSPTGYNFVTADFANVSSLVFTNDCGSCGGRWYLMDDFTYTPTPEPGTLVLLGSSVLGLGGLLRRKLSI
ncbi:MAG: PEP-CTERM sorting domain-containing protein [Candidatus Korobacteraceae bacterium]|jgi:hypothetical protein